MGPLVPPSGFGQSPDPQPFDGERAAIERVAFPGDVLEADPVGDPYGSQERCTSGSLAM